MSKENKQPPLQEAVLFPTDNEFDMSLWNNSQTDIWPQLRKRIQFNGKSIFFFIKKYFIFRR